METLGEDGDVLSDKTAAKACATSERQIRKARQEGMNPYLADYLVVKGLGVHPMSVFGADWLTAEALYADEIKRGRMTSDEARAKVAGDVDADLGEDMAVA